MSVPSRLAAFAVLIGLVFGGAVLLGAAVDPTDEPVKSAGHGEMSDAARPAHGDAASAAAPTADGGHDQQESEGTMSEHGNHESADTAVSGLAALCSFASRRRAGSITSAATASPEKVQKMAL